MRRVGSIVYELSEQDYKKIKNALSDITYYFNTGSDKDDAEEGARILEEIFEEDGY